MIIIVMMMVVIVVIVGDGVVTKSFLKYLQNIGLTKSLKSGAKNSTITNLSYCTQIPKTCPLTLLGRMNFLPLTEPNPTRQSGIGAGFPADSS